MKLNPIDLSPLKIPLIDALPEKLFTPERFGGVLAPVIELKLPEPPELPPAA